MRPKGPGEVRPPVSPTHPALHTQPCTLDPSSTRLGSAHPALLTWPCLPSPAHPALQTQWCTHSPAHPGPEDTRPPISPAHPALHTRPCSPRPAHLALFTQRCTHSPAYPGPEETRPPISPAHTALCQAGTGMAAPMPFLFIPVGHRANPPQNAPHPQRLSQPSQAQSPQSPLHCEGQSRAAGGMPRCKHSQTQPQRPWGAWFFHTRDPRALGEKHSLRQQEGGGGRELHNLLTPSRPQTARSGTLSPRLAQGSPP